MSALGLGCAVFAPNLSQRLVFRGTTSQQLAALRDFASPLTASGSPTAVLTGRLA